MESSQETHKNWLQIAVVIAALLGGGGLGFQIRSVDTEQLADTAVRKQGKRIEFLEDKAEEQAKILLRLEGKIDALIQTATYKKGK